MTPTTLRSKASPVSDEFNLQGTTNHARGPLERGDCYVSVSRIKQTTDLAAAGLHSLGKAFPGKILCLHRSRDLPGQNFFDRNSLELFELALVLQEAIERCQIANRALCLLSLHDAILMD